MQVVDVNGNMFGYDHLEIIGADGRPKTLDSGLTSVGLSMPSAFTVSNSPLTSNGTIGVTGAGTTSQYIDGTGALRTFPSLSGYVTAVTASAPLSSSGGTTPNITIPQANISTSGFLSATDWNTFNSKQPAGNYITALSGEASGSGPGTASVTLNNASVTAKVLTGVNITGGSINASDSILTAFGKIQNQINGLIGSSIYQGTWNALTNTPALTSGVGTRGYYYIVNVAGSTNLDGITDWNVGDWAIFDGTAWQQVDNTDSVTSVNGQTGAVSLTSDNIPEGATNLYFTSLRSRQALSLTTSGSSGASTYDNTTGVLNIPNYGSALSGYVPYTGATQDVNLGIYRIAASAFTKAGGASTEFLKADGSIDSNTYLTTGAAASTYVPLSRTLTINGTAYDLSANRTWSVGTVTSVDMTVPTGLTVTGNPITGAGTFALGLQSGYSIPTTANQSNWTTAYNRSIVSAAVNYGIASTSLVLTQQNTGTITAGLIAGGATTNDFVFFNGSNLAYTQLNATAPLSFNGATKTFSISQASGSTNGFLSSTDWNTFNNKQNAITLTTTGTSGPATLIGNTLNIPQYQDVITNPVTGTGTANYVARWTSSSNISTGVLYDNGTNVGIATTALGSWAKLQVAGNVALTGSLLSFSDNLAGGSTPAYLDYNYSLGKLIVGSYGPSALGHIVLETGGTEKVRITSTGNVGIGVTGPQGKLHVYGGRFVLDNPLADQTAIQFNQSGTEMAVLYRPGAISNQMRFFLTGAGDVMTWASSSNVGIGTTSPATKLDVNGGINIANGNNLTWGGTYADGIPTIVGYNAGTGGALYFYPNGSTSGEKMRLHASGNLSIGNTNNTYKLDVEGTGRFSGNVLVNNVATSGYAFTSVAGSWASGSQIYTAIKIGAASDNLVGTGVDLRAYSNYASNAGTEFRLFVNNSSNVLTEALRIASNQAATFSSSVTATAFNDGFINIGGAQINRTGGAVEIQFVGGGDVRFFGNTAYPITFTAGTGAATFSSSVTAGGNIISRTANYPQIVFEETTSSTNSLIFYDNVAAPKQLGFRVNSASNVLTLTSTNVGIGTTSPSARLTVVGDGSGTAQIGSAGFGSNYTAISLNGTLSTGAYNFLSSTSDNHLYINRPTGNDIYFRMNNADQVSIKSSGNVGIGTSDPATKLHVENGVIRATGTNSSSGQIDASPSYGAFRFYNGVDFYGGLGMGQWAGVGISTDIVQYLSSGVNYHISNVSTPVFTVSSGGNVGIGTTAPSTKLQVAGNIYVSNNGGNVSFNRPGGQNVGAIGWYSNDSFYVAGHPDYGPVAGNDVRVYGFGSNLYLGSSSGGDVVTITPSARMGINNTNPGYRLEVNGGSDTFVASFINSSAAQSFIRVGDTSDLNYSGLALYSDSGTGQIFKNGTGSNSWGGNASLNIYNSNGSIAFHPNNTANAMFIATNGNVGIGTTSPSQKLHVSGNLRVTGAIYDSNNTAGTSGQVLSSTGSGTDWVDAPTSTATSVYDLLPGARVDYNWTGQVVNGAWVDVFTRASILLTTGTWMVKMYVSDFATGGEHYQYTYSGTFTWYQDGTNQSGTPAASEIALHRMGHAANSTILYLRTTEEVAAVGGNGRFQISGNYSHFANTTINFKFVKII
jgi:hypothetical protein